MSFQPNYDQGNLAQIYAQEAQKKAHREFGPIVTVDGYGPPRDDELYEPESTRGEAWSDLVSCLTSPLLRIGFLLQLLVLVFGYALYYGHGGTGVFTFDLFSTPEKLRASEAHATIMIALESVYLCGCICISSFQIYVSDNSKLTRGFRAGSKMLAAAATLDTFVVGLRLMAYVYAYQFLGNRWWMKHTQSNADWCLFYFGAFVHSISLILYGLAIFYMEAYHDEGTYEEWSWILLTLFSVAGLFEFFLVFTGFGHFYTIVHLVALGAAAFWAFSFEPLLHFYSPVFHDRDLNADMRAVDENQELPEIAHDFKLTGY